MLTEPAIFAALLTCPLMKSKNFTDRKLLNHHSFMISKNETEAVKQLICDLELASKALLLVTSFIAADYRPAGQRYVSYL